MEVRFNCKKGERKSAISSLAFEGKWDNNILYGHTNIIPSPAELQTFLKLKNTVVISP